MSGTVIELEAGSHVRVQRDGSVPELWRVLKRKRGGWQVQHAGDDPVTWSDGYIHELRLDHGFEVYPSDPEVDDEHIARCLSKAFEAFPDTHKTIALRRSEYVRGVDQRHEGGSTLEECYEAVPGAVWDEFMLKWKAEDEVYAAVLAERRRERGRKPVEQLKRKPKGQPLVAPKPRTVELWYRTWVTHGRDVRVLLPDFGGRGDRTLKYDPWVYEQMRVHIDLHYLVEDGRRPPLTYAWGKFKGFCKKEKGLDEDAPRKKGEPRPYPTYATFLAFKDAMLDARQETKIRKGGRTAYLTFNVFRRTQAPGKVMAEIEFDHSLIDLIVVDEGSGKPLGRPWLTAALDRASRCIVGCHVSFEVPSFAALQRCMGHAFWPKDLRGIEGLTNSWPCEGIPDFAFVDNGKEFRSASLRSSEKALNFYLRPLPVMTPWLKGAIERLFGRFNAQVYAHKQGKTFHSAVERGEYDSIKRAETSLSEIRRDLLEYIVDDYHVTKHRTLKARPLDVWDDLVVRQNGIRPVPTHAHIIELIGQVVYKPISNVGINHKGLNYHSDELTLLRERRGGLQKLYEVRFDPFDLWRIYVLDEETGRHIPVDCTNQEIARGVSIFGAGLHLKLARRLGSGKHVTEHDILHAKREAESQSARILGDGRRIVTSTQAARYACPNGEYFTPVPSLWIPDPAPLIVASRPVLPIAVSAAPKALPAPAPTTHLLPPPSADARHQALTEGLDDLLKEWDQG